MGYGPRALFSFEYTVNLTFDRAMPVPCLVSVYRPDEILENGMKIGYFGGAGEPDLSGKLGTGVTDRGMEFSRKSGKNIAEINKELSVKLLPVTGAAPGIPHAFAESCAENGIWPIGLSPFYDQDRHLRNGSHIDNLYNCVT